MQTFGNKIKSSFSYHFVTWTKVILVVGHFLLSFEVSAQYGKETVIGSLRDAGTSRWTLIPFGLALAIGLTGVDGDIRDYVADNHHIFGDTKSAKRYGDTVTFYLLPLNALGTGIYHYAVDSRAKWWSTLLFIPSAAATVFTNSLIKDNTGRLRPDHSNTLSFPSSHAALASALTHESYINLKPHISRKWSIIMPIIQETIVLSVAWSRLEAQKHHLSDVLAGYGIGKFFSTFINSLFFARSHRSEVNIYTNWGKMYNVRLTWQI